MNNLMIKGTQNIQGKEVKVIEGGFGEGQKCMLASDIAKQHDVETKYINKIINNNLRRFNENDLIDFLGSSKELRNYARENGLIISNSTKNIFLLSERGYTKLVSMMSNDNEKKWEVMDKLIDDYFAMRKRFKSEEELKKELAYKVMVGGIDAIEAHKQLVEIETKPLIENNKVLTKNLMIQKDIIEEFKPKAEYYDEAMSKKSVLKVELIAMEFGMSARELNKLLHTLKIQYKQGKQWVLYSKYKDKGYTVSRKGFTHTDGRVEYSTYWTEKGREFITMKLKEIGRYSIMSKEKENQLEFWER